MVESTGVTLGPVIQYSGDLVKGGGSESRPMQGEDQERTQHKGSLSRSQLAGAAVA